MTSPLRGEDHRFESGRAHIFFLIRMEKKKTTFLTVDAIIIQKDEIVLIKRGDEPFKGCWAFPGGMVEYNESVENAVVREAKEETGLDVKIEKLFKVYSAPGRDPRGHSVSVCFLCKIIGGNFEASTDAAEVRFFKLSALPKLAFDHAKILNDVIKNRK